jgi:AmmeMemoRadiSam system protein B
MFYPESAQELEDTLRSLFLSTSAYRGESSVFGILAPHAGYTYSGRVAAAAYSRIPAGFSGTFVVIGPSHAGCETCTSDLFWETPIGNVPPDADLAEALEENGIPIRNDLMRVQENSLETQMPFLRFRFPEACVVPVLLGDQSPAAAEKTAAAITAAVSGSRTIIVASGDGSHYVPAETAKTNDLAVFSALADLDTGKFYAALEAVQPSMCGYGCIAVMADVCRNAGASSARVLLYDTSGSVSGDTGGVVGYAALEVV